MGEKIEDILLNLQPYYDELNSRYSKSYLSGSIWYVGDDLQEWWSKCNNIRYASDNIFKIEVITFIILESLFKEKRTI